MRRQVDVRLGAARESDGVAQLHARREAHLSLDPDVAAHGDEAALAVGHGVDGDRVSRAPSAPRAPRRRLNWSAPDGDHHARPPARAPRRRRQDPVDRDPGLRGRGIEPAGKRDRVLQRLGRAHLVHRGPHDPARHRHEGRRAPARTRRRRSGAGCRWGCCRAAGTRRGRGCPPACRPRRISTCRNLPLVVGPPAAYSAVSTVPALDIW